MAVGEAYEFIVQWHLTERCNLRCRHCYQEGAKTRVLPRETIVRGVAEVARMLRDWQEAYDLAFAPSFNVTGGEPFLHPDFWTVLKDMVQAGFPCYVLSNGALITPPVARRLDDLGVKGVQVSLEGPEAIHDQVRGVGSFHGAVTGIGNLMAAGLRVLVNTTLSRVNAWGMRDLVDLAASLGVHELGFSRLVPAGRGSSLAGDMLSISEVRELYEMLLNLEIPGLEIGTGDPVAAQQSSPPPSPETAPIPAGGCAAGVAGLTILPDGVVTPCRRLPLPLGTLGRDSLREIWAASPILARLRDRSQYQGACGRCRRWSRCRGCRAISYASSQALGRPDFLAPDPQCFLTEGVGG